MNLASLFANKFFEYLLNIKEESLVEGNAEVEIFPPWQASPSDFKNLCTGCGECAHVCKQDLIHLGKDGTPRVDFTENFCTFCGDCARSCPEGALAFSPDQPPWQLQLSITHTCLMESNVLCQLCQEACEQGAITFLQGGQGGQRPLVLSENCNGCGACIARCPVNAIFLQYN